MAKNGATTPVNSGDFERGPSWYDVFDLLSRLESRTDGRIRPVIASVKSAYPKWGLRISIRVVGLRDPIAHAGYGSAYQGGCKTLAAAYWLALTRAEEWLDATGVSLTNDEAI